MDLAEIGHGQGTNRLDSGGGPDSLMDPGLFPGLLADRA